MNITLNGSRVNQIFKFFDKYSIWVIGIVLSMVSIFTYIIYLQNGLGLSYNDARSHLDIGRRVVEGLKPGMAQLGSVWLPLPHILMIPTIWNDFMWHSGLAGALQSMISYVTTGLIIFWYLRALGVGLFGSYVAVLIFAVNMNILYLQSTAMTELLLITTLSAASYQVLRWFQTNKLINLIYSSIWVMLASLNRYEGWFLFVYVALLVSLYTLKRYGYKQAEGKLVFFCTMGGLGIALWLLWNLIIFDDPLFFAFGPYSAHAHTRAFPRKRLIAVGDADSGGERA